MNQKVLKEPKKLFERCSFGYKKSIEPHVPQYKILLLSSNYVTTSTDKELYYSEDRTNQICINGRLPVYYLEEKPLFELGFLVILNEIIFSRIDLCSFSLQF